MTCCRASWSACGGSSTARTTAIPGAPRTRSRCRLASPPGLTPLGADRARVVQHSSASPEEDRSVSQNSSFPTPALERVREGMTVLDESGRRLGTVARVRMGDPQAVTTRGEQPPSGDPGVVVAPTAEAGGPTGLGFVGPVLGGGSGGPDLPDPLRRHLLRTGFVEVDGPDLEAPARYVPGDRVADVSDGTVHLRPAPT